jgi:predicted phage terminase large subunit-like protein
VHAVDHQRAAALQQDFLAWTLGQFPDAEFIHTSYSARLAANNAWHARELVTHEEYRQIFPKVQLRGDSAARDEWRTTEGGIVYAVGTGGTITGYGAGKERPEFGGAILIDDPHKADEARSDTMRQGVIEWFQNTLESRKNSPARTPIVLIMQRLHETDLSGWLLGDRSKETGSNGAPVAGGNGEVWEHVCLPAMNEDGSALWPEKHTAEQLQVMETAAPLIFAGQYQQAPAPPEGIVFRPDAMPIINAVPPGTVFVRGWDLAGTADGGDWTVGVKMGRIPADGRIVVADVVRLQGAPHEVEAALKNTAERDGKDARIGLPQDPGQAGKAQVRYLTGQMPGHIVRSAPVTGDKVTRAEPFAAQVNVGNVCLLRAPWNDAYIAELRTFPNAAHDDQVDASSEAFALLPARASTPDYSRGGLPRINPAAA